MADRRPVAGDPHPRVACGPGLPGLVHGVEAVHRAAGLAEAESGDGPDGREILRVGVQVPTAPPFIPTTEMRIVARPASRARGLTTWLPSCRLNLAVVSPVGKAKGPYIHGRPGEGCRSAGHSLFALGRRSVGKKLMSSGSEAQATLIACHAEPRVGVAADRPAKNPPRPSWRGWSTPRRATCPSPCPARAAARRTCGDVFSSSFG